jgi:chaperonin cofactor prefoldin
MKKKQRYVIVNTGHGPADFEERAKVLDSKMVNKIFESGQRKVLFVELIDGERIWVNFWKDWEDSTTNKQRGIAMITKTIEEMKQEIEEKKEQLAVKEKATRDYMWELSDDEAESVYEDYLNENEKDATCCGYTFSAGYALRLLDETAFRTDMINFFDNEENLSMLPGYDDLKEEISELESEIDDLETELEELEGDYND